MKLTMREFICIAALGVFAFGVNSASETERNLLQLYDSVFSVKHHQ